MSMTYKFSTCIPEGMVSFPQTKSYIKFRGNIMYLGREKPFVNGSIMKFGLASLDILNILWPRETK